MRYFIRIISIIVLFLSLASCDKESMGEPQYEEIYTAIPALEGDGCAITFSFEYDERYGQKGLPTPEDYIFHVYKMGPQIGTEPYYGNLYEEYFVVPYSQMPFPLLLDPGEYKFLIHSKKGYSKLGYPYVVQWQGAGYVKVDSRLIPKRIKFIMHAEQYCYF